jgi:hypothetical protein
MSENPKNLDPAKRNKPWYGAGGWYAGYDVLVKAKVQADNPMKLNDPNMRYALVGSAHKLKCPECMNSFLLEMKNAEVFCCVACFTTHSKLWVMEFNERKATLGPAPVPWPRGLPKTDENLRSIIGKELTCSDCKKAAKIESVDCNDGTGEYLVDEWYCGPCTKKQLAAMDWKTNARVKAELKEERDQVAPPSQHDQEDPVKMLEEEGGEKSLGACECGATKCGDNQHSGWCPAK